MMSATRLVLPTLAAVAIGGCAANTSNATQNTDADVKAIDAIRAREVAIVTSGSVDSMSAIYTDDVDFMPPGEPAIHGIEAAKKWTQAMMAQMNLAANYTSSRVTVSGDLAVDRYTGTFGGTPKAGGPAMTEVIKGVHVLKRQPGGGWKIMIDTYNADAPEAPPATAPTADAKKDAAKKK
jgi:ketosteroid isomerase-like protein